MIPKSKRAHGACSLEEPHPKFFPVIKIFDLDGIAVSEGPGSYTGLRIGMSLAKGLAIKDKVPIIPVPTLSVIAKGTSRTSEYWVLLHSHKNIVYAQRFNEDKPVSKIDCREFDLELYKDPVGFNLNMVCASDQYESSAPSSKNVGELALENAHNWSVINYDKLTPNYITTLKN